MPQEPGHSDCGELELVTAGRLMGRVSDLRRLYISLGYAYVRLAQSVEGSKGAGRSSPLSKTGQSYVASTAAYV